MTAQFGDEIMIIFLYNDRQVLLKLVKTSSMVSGYCIRAAILGCVGNRARVFGTAAVVGYTSAAGPF